jgi:putative colanic acid biosynthesis UDP-glucose lipid carrier transferase
MTDRATTARLAILGIDLLLASGIFAFSMWWNLGRGSEIDNWWWMFFLPALQVIAYQLAGAYDSPLPGRAWQWLQGALTGQALFGIAIAVCLYLGDFSHEVPRLAFAAWFVASSVLVASGRLLMRALWLKVQRQGTYSTRVVLAGSLVRCRQVAAHLVAHPELELEVVGFASNDTLAGIPAPDLPLARTEDLAALAFERQAGRVLICASLADEELIDGLVVGLTPFPLEIQVVPDLSHFPFLSLGSEDLAGVPALNLSRSPMTARDLLVKRLEDLVLSTLIIIIISPVMVLVAIAVKCSGPGPILYAQRRHGFLGRTITVYKFRTMTWSGSQVPDADDATPANAAKEFLNPRTDMFRQAKGDDARVTPLGKFLRSSSFDELPQFFNVLRGDMSIVGPRPHARRHNLEFIDRVPGLMWRHYVKPGITGLAQISGARGRTATAQDMGRRIEFDLQYIREWSLWLDLRIIVTTIFIGFYNREP